MTPARLDAVIVGGGHNGLTAAAYLARAGLAVEVLERREIVGGACVTEELWPGQGLEDRPDRRRIGGIEALYLAGSGAHPGGAVTGAPGARAVIEDLI